MAMKKRILGILLLSVLLSMAFASIGAATEVKVTQVDANDIHMLKFAKKTYTYDLSFDVTADGIETKTVKYEVRSGGDFIKVIPDRNTPNNISVRNGMTNVKWGLQPQAQGTAVLHIEVGNSAASGDLASKDITITVEEVPELKIEKWSFEPVHVGNTLSFDFATNYDSSKDMLRVEVPSRIDGLKNVSVDISKTPFVFSASADKVMTKKNLTLFTLKLASDDSMKAEFGLAVTISGDKPIINITSVDKTIKHSGNVDSKDMARIASVDIFKGGTVYDDSNTPFELEVWGAKSLTVAISKQSQGGVFALSQQGQKAASGDYAEKASYKLKVKIPDIKEDTEFSVTIKAKSNADLGETEDKETEHTYKIYAYANPNIDKQKDITVKWGEAVDFTPKASNVNTWAVITSNDISGDITNLPFYGLSLDASSGKIFGTWKSHDIGSGKGEVKLADAKSVTKTLNLVGWNKSNNLSDDYSFNLVFTGVAPVISESATVAKIEEKSKVLIVHQPLSSGDKIIRIPAEGPGNIMWTIKNGSKTVDLVSGDEQDKAKDVLPKGLYATVSAEPSKSYESVLIISGEPEVTFKPTKITITATNKVGKGKQVTPTFQIGLNEIKIGGAHSGDIPSGDKKVGYEIKIGNDTEITLSADPAEVTWKATNLPAGLKLKDNKDGTATLSGKLTRATTKKALDGNNTVYEIVATSTNFKDITAILSADIKVFDPPEVTTKGLKDITVGEPYDSGELKAKGDPKSWDVTFTSKDKNSWLDKFIAPNGQAYISFDAVNKKIVGSIDRMPGGTIYVRVVISNDVDSTSKDLELKAKGVAPSFTTTAISTIKGSDGGSRDIVTAGTLPIYMKAYIDGSTAKKLFGEMDKTYDGKKTIPLDSDDKNISGFYFDSSADLGTGLLSIDAGAGRAYLNIPITIEASNDIKKITKKFSVTVIGNKPKWYIVSADNRTPTSSPSDVFRTETSGVEIGSRDTTTGYWLIASGDLPMTVKVSQKLKEGSNNNDKNGIIVELSEDKRLAYYIHGKPTAKKETKTTITFTATNPSTGDKDTSKITFTAQLPPEITTNDRALAKEVELGKNLSVKLSAKGTKTITWQVVSIDKGAGQVNVLGDNGKESLDVLGLKFDGAKGTIAGKPSSTNNLTLSGDKYHSWDVYVVASNAAGSSDKAAKVQIGIKGAKPKIITKTITIKRGEPDSISKDNDGDNKGIGNLLKIDRNNNRTSAYFDSIDFYPANTTEETKLTGLGFSATIVSMDNRRTGRLSADVKGLKANRGQSVKFAANNYDSVATGSVKIVIEDPRPDADSKDYTLNITANPDRKVTEEQPLTLSSDTVTGDSKIRWSITNRPANNTRVTAKITADRSDPTKATLELSVPKGLAQSNGYSVTVRATNQNLKDKNTNFVDITVHGEARAVAAPTENTEKKPEAPEDVAARPESAPEAEPEALPEDEAELYDDDAEEGTITFGAERTIDSLTAEQRAAIEEAGYKIIAVLPETTVDISGQYDLDTDLAEDAPEGAELAYFALPVEDETTEDDEIVDFYDEAGADISAVPENKKVIVSPWFTAEKTYAPVIAVKADEAAGAKDNAEDLKEGDIVTEQAIEEKEAE